MACQRFIRLLLSEGIDIGQILISIYIFLLPILFCRVQPLILEGYVQQLVAISILAAQRIVFYSLVLC